MAVLGFLLIVFAVLGALSVSIRKLRGKGESDSWKGIAGTFVVLSGVGLWLISSDSELEPGGIKAREAVHDTLKKPKSKYVTGGLYSAPLAGGHGVIAAGSYAGLDGPFLATYWVKDGIVYSANGLAMTYSPGIKKSPEGIGDEEVTNAVKAVN